MKRKIMLCTLGGTILITVVFCVLFIIFLVKSDVVITVVHINDFHSKYEETSIASAPCISKSCIGGFARIVYMVRMLRKSKNVLLLDAGDNYVGSPYYKFFKWNITMYFLNMLPFDAHVLGHAEFTDGVEGLVPYLKRLKHPVVVCNIDTSEEPALDETYSKSVIVYRDGKAFGITGVLTTDTPNLANTGKVKILNEVESLNKEVDELERKGVFTVIVLSHCGLEVDKDIALHAASKISLIVGGHSHSLLQNENATNMYDKIVGTYPLVVHSENGHDVLIVQARAFSKYLGNLTIRYDSKGHVKLWEGNTIFLDVHIKEDKNILKLLSPWQYTLYEKKKVVIGEAAVDLTVTGCQLKECLMGNFYADVLNHAYENISDFAIVYPGVLIHGLKKGGITYEKLHRLLPFSNTIDFAMVQGRHLWDLFETGASRLISKHKVQQVVILQVSSKVRVTYNLSKPTGQRLRSLKINSVKVDPDKVYNFTLHSFILITGLKEIQKHFLYYRTGPIDIDIFYDYIENYSPVSAKLEGRIVLE